MKLILATILAFAATLSYADVKSCLNCHGEGSTPQIAGLSLKYLQSEIAHYKNKERACTEVTGKDGVKSDMCKVVVIDTDLQELSKVKFVPCKQNINADLAAKGKDIHKANCEKCHSESGSLPGDDAGILAGQNSDYLRATLKEFKEGKRTIDKKMKAKLEELDNDSIEALINYYASFNK
jgi:sulfide dehydrogenase cytochrome subunit